MSVLNGKGCYHKIGVVEVWVFHYISCFAEQQHHQKHEGDSQQAVVKEESKTVHVCLCSRPNTEWILFTKTSSLGHIEQITRLCQATEKCHQIGKQVEGEISSTCTPSTTAHPQPACNQGSSHNDKYRLFQTCRWFLSQNDTLTHQYIKGAHAFQYTLQLQETRMEPPYPYIGMFKSVSACLD